MEGGAVLIRYGKNHPGFFPGWVKYAVSAVVLLGIVCFAALCSLVVSGMKTSARKNLDYVVVLGAHVKGDVPSKAAGAGREIHQHKGESEIFGCAYRLQPEKYGNPVQ